MTPDGTDTPERTSFTSGYSATFTVKNTGSAQDTYTLYCFGSTNVTCTGTWTSVTLNPGKSKFIPVSYEVGTSGWGRIHLQACNPGDWCDTGYYDVPVVGVPPVVEIHRPTPTVYTSRPLIEVRYSDSETYPDTATLEIKIDGQPKTHLFRRSKGLAEWELDAAHALIPGTPVNIWARICDTDAMCAETSRTVVLSDADPQLSVVHRPLEDQSRQPAPVSSGGFSIVGGEVVSGVSTPVYRSLDVDRSVQLVYSSLQSYPRRLASVNVEFPSTPTSTEALLYDGTTLLGSVAYNPATCSSTCRLALQVDHVGTAASNSVVWSPDMRLAVGAGLSGGYREGSVELDAPIVDRRSSPYGAGWWVEGLEYLAFAEYDSGNPNVVMVVHADGRAEIFRGYEGGYVSPPGDRSRLISGVPWRREFPEGSHNEYDAATGAILKRSAPNGRHTTYSYNPDGTLYQIKDALGKAFTFHYSSGKLTHVSDPGGRITFFDLDASGRLWRVRGPGGPTLASFGYVTYSEANRQYLLASIADPLNASAEVLYRTGACATCTWRPFRIELPTPAPGETRPAVEFTLSELRGLYTQGSTGNPAAALADTFTRVDELYWNYQTASLGWRGTDTWWNRWGQVTRTQFPDGLVTRATYDEVGRVLRTWDIRNDSLSYTYDSIGYPRTVADHRRGTTDSTFYDAEGKLTRAVNRNGKVVTYEYAVSTNNLLRVIDFRLNPSAADTTAYSYTSFGRIHRAVAPGMAGEFEYEYDPVHGNLRAVTDPAGERPFAKIFDQYGRAWQDSAHFQSSFGTTTVRVTTRWLNPLNVADSIEATDAGRIRYTYDDAGRLETVRNSHGGQTTYAYDAIGRVRGHVYPDGARDSLAYDLQGNLIYHRTRRGHVIRSTDFDIADRLLTKEIPATGPGGVPLDGEGVWTYTYTLHGQLDFVDHPSGSLGDIDYAYDAFGRVQSVTAAGAMLSYGYDELDSVEWVTHPIPEGGTGTTRYAYDSKERPSRLETYSLAGDTVSYLYRTFGALRSKTVWWDTRNNGIKTTFERDSDGRTGSIALGTYSFDLPKSNERGNSEWGLRVYKRSESDWLLRDTLFTLEADTLAWLHTRTYSYDGFGRLASIHTFERDPVHEVQETLENYSYDLMSNRYTPDSFGGSLESYDTLTQRLLSRSAWNYGYDAAGNLTSRTGGSHDWTYFYNALGQLVEVQYNSAVQAQYRYDAVGNRISAHNATSGETTEFVYDRGNVILDRVAGTYVAYYAWGPEADELLVFRRFVSGSWRSYYPVQDHRGSVIQVLDRTKAQVNRYTYGPHGETGGWTSEQVPLRYRFTGREWDGAALLYFYRARWYDPYTARFTQEDPAGGPAANPYAYLTGDAVNGRDPSGLMMAPEYYSGEPGNGGGGSDWGDGPFGRPWWDLSPSQWMAVQEARHRARMELMNYDYDAYTAAWESAHGRGQHHGNYYVREHRMRALGPDEFDLVKAVVMSELRGVLAWKGLAMTHQLFSTGHVSGYISELQAMIHHQGTVYVYAGAFRKSDVQFASTFAHEVAHATFFYEGSTLPHYPSAGVVNPMSECAADVLGAAFVGGGYIRQYPPYRYVC